MSDTNKQIPSPHDFLMDKGGVKSNKDVIHVPAVQRWLGEYAKLVVKYTLEQAAENAKTDTVEAPTYAEENVSVSKRSILSLEDQIIKNLKL